MPAEFTVNGYEGYPDLDDPWFEAKPADHYDPWWRPLEGYNRWMERYGPGGPEDLHRKMASTDGVHLMALQAWCYGAQLAGTIHDNDAILAALKSASEIPTMQGPAYFWG